MLAFLANELAYCKMLSNSIKIESNYINLKQINGLCEFNLVEIILGNMTLKLRFYIAKLY